MIEALTASMGIVTTACHSTGICRTTHYDWLKKDEVYRAAVSDLEDLALDFAESALLKQIKKGEISSTIFYLKTKGKKRGYVEKQEIENVGDIPITEINWKVIMPQEIKDDSTKDQN